jgi:hypothetical protein
VKTQLRELTENDVSRIVVTTCIVPSVKTRSSRTTLSGSVGRFGSSTILPTPSKTPLARTVVATTTRSPDCPEATIVPVNVSLPLVAAAPDEATASAAHAARTAASAPLFR